MPDNFKTTWDFADKHVDESINPTTDLISSARCLIYAKPSSFSSDDPNAAATFYRCGLIQNYSFQEQRDISRIFELGSDIPYIIPGRTTGYLSLSRIMLFGNDLVNMLYYSAKSAGADSESVAAEQTDQSKIIRSINDLKTPVDILITYFAEKDFNGNVKRYTRQFKHCMITSRGESVDANQIIVGENVQITYAKMGPVKIS